MGRGAGMSADPGLRGGLPRSRVENAPDDGTSAGVHAVAVDPHAKH